MSNNYNEYYVLNRDNGQPLANTQAQLWESSYNYQTSSYEEKKAEKYTTDKNGYFKIKDTKQYRNFLIQYNYNTEELFMDENNAASYYNSYTETIRPQTFL